MISGIAMAMFLLVATPELTTSEIVVYTVCDEPAVVYVRKGKEYRIFPFHYIYSVPDVQVFLGNVILDPFHTERAHAIPNYLCYREL